jgi:hypothetical protein
MRVAMVSVSTILRVVPLEVTPVRYEYVPRRSPTRPGPQSGVSTAQFTQSIQPCAKLATTVRKSKRMSSATISTIVRNRPAL